MEYKKSPYQLMKSVLRGLLTADHLSRFRYFRTQRDHGINNIPPSQSTALVNLLAGIDDAEAVLLCQIMSIDRTKLDGLINSMLQFEAIKESVADMTSEAEELEKLAMHLEKENAEPGGKNAKNDKLQRTLYLRAKNLQKRLANTRASLLKIPSLSLGHQDPAQAMENRQRVVSSTFDNTAGRVSAECVVEMRPALSGSTYKSLNSTEGSSSVGRKSIMNRTIHRHNGDKWLRAKINKQKFSKSSCIRRK